MMTLIVLFVSLLVFRGHVSGEHQRGPEASPPARQASNPSLAAPADASTLRCSRCMDRPGITVEMVQDDLICKIPPKGRLWSTAPEQDDPVSCILDKPRNWNPREDAHGMPLFEYTTLMKRKGVTR